MLRRIVKITTARFSFPLSSDSRLFHVTLAKTGRRRIWQGKRRT